VVTRPADHAILRGITRTVLFDVIKAQGFRLEGRPGPVATVLRYEFHKYAEFG
jgi:D-alanine transaminase